MFDLTLSWASLKSWKGIEIEMVWHTPFWIPQNVFQTFAFLLGMTLKSNSETFFCSWFSVLLCY